MPAGLLKKANAWLQPNHADGSRHTFGLLESDFAIQQTDSRGRFVTHKLQLSSSLAPA